VPAVNSIAAVKSTGSFRSAEPGGWDACGGMVAGGRGQDCSGAARLRGREVKVCSLPLRPCPLSQPWRTCPLPSLDPALPPAWLLLPETSAVCPP
jgi:hypothetical protein